MHTQAPVHVGTSGWHYGHWRESFYPDNLSAGRFLACYAAHNALQLQALLRQG